MDLVRKTFNSKITDIDFENKEATVTISSDSIDRHESIISASVWDQKTIDDFMKHPVLLADHHYWDLRNNIGSFLRIWTERTQEGVTEVKARAKWFVENDDKSSNPLAEWAWKLVSKFKIAAFSIGFVKKEYIDGHDERVTSIYGKGSVDEVITKAEILETSQVLVPSNRDSVSRSCKFYESDKLFHSYMAKDSEIKAAIFEFMNKHLSVEESETVPETKDADTDKNTTEEKGLVEAITKLIEKIEETNSNISAFAESVKARVSSKEQLPAGDTDTKKAEMRESALKRLETSIKILKGESNI